jgi:hypothetical protein
LSKVALEGAIRHRLSFAGHVRDFGADRGGQRIAFMHPVRLVRAWHPATRYLGELRAHRLPFRWAVVVDVETSDLEAVISGERRCARLIRRPRAVV